MKQRKKLTRQEEFEILKLVLDKFLWLGIFLMGWGLFEVFNRAATSGFTLIIVGAIVLVLFLIIIVKEYEIIK